MFQPEVSSAQNEPLSLTDSPREGDAQGRSQEAVSSRNFSTSLSGPLVEGEPFGARKTTNPTHAVSAIDVCREAEPLNRFQPSPNTKLFTKKASVSSMCFHE